MRPYIESFLPLFVAINPLGIIPIYLSLTEKLSSGERRRLTLQAMMTALGLSIVILFAGQLIFSSEIKSDTIQQNPIHPTLASIFGNPRIECVRAPNRDTPEHR